MFHFQPTHVNELVLVSSWFQRQQQQLMQGAMFLTSSSGLCLLQEAIIPLPCHSLWSSSHAAVFCPSYLYLVTALQMIEGKRGGTWSSYLFSYKYPSCSIKPVCCLENVCCWSVGITLITDAVEWNTMHLQKHSCTWGAASLLLC